jgi:hypothetical protein
LNATARDNEAIIELVFEFDSHEDIRRSFGGDYLLRLRA